MMENTCIRGTKPQSIQGKNAVNILHNIPNSTSEKSFNMSKITAYDVNTAQDGGTKTQTNRAFIATLFTGST